MDMFRTLQIICLLCWTGNTFADNRYLTWVDDQGAVHNTLLNETFTQQQSIASKHVQQSEVARFNQADDLAAGRAIGESKRRYFTWVDANGTLQNSFYANRSLLSGGDEVLLSTGQSSSDYIDADVLEGRGYQREGDDGQYYTWVDEQGRVQNSLLSPRISSEASSASGAIEFTEGRQVKFVRKPVLIPNLDGQRNAAMTELLVGSKPSGGLYAELTDRCCTQLTDDDFTDLSVDEPRFEELNRFSPSFDFPMGRSYYAAIKLPKTTRRYGLRVRSFANKQVVYPSLLFLDEQKRPTRLVSDAVYQLHAETWSHFAFIQGTIEIQAATRERYVLVLTTDEDKGLSTLDNQPFKRPIQDVVVDEAGVQVHAHVGVGSFELAVVQ
ncbi:MalM family protein [Pseudomonas sp. NPDC078700]|uniref:MalM family protein n=1 Tax=Pseudomonas sp. NPDC078700 TaxID=3364424 RepID=UPI0037C83310